MKKSFSCIILFFLAFRLASFNYIKRLDEVRLSDIALVGGKNASLGELLHSLKSTIRVPMGFALTTDAFYLFIEENNLREKLHSILQDFDPTDISALQDAGMRARELLVSAQIPRQLHQEVAEAYAQLCTRYNQESVDVAVRSSATAEDLPDASFAGQQDTYLNIKGVPELLEACKRCFASLFTDRAIAYRISQGFDHFEVALSIGVQKMVRSDLACSGVAFSIDPESGFKDVVSIESVYGLGEQLVQGCVNPDAYCVYKPKVLEGCAAVINKRLGDKHQRMVYHNDGVKIESVPQSLQRSFCLREDEIIELASMVMSIESHYAALKGEWCPMDVEWAKDGIDGKLYIVQARPETVHSQIDDGAVFHTYSLGEACCKDAIIGRGQSVGKQIVSGRVRIIRDLSDIHSFQEGEILVTHMTDPDWVPVMKKAAGIVTELGGRTCHAAIVSRELRVPAIVGSHNIIDTVKDGQIITLDCSQGSEAYVYDGHHDYSKTAIDCSALQIPEAQLLVNIADPSRAFHVAQLPFVSGVGLARLEFIITNMVKAHPMAFVCPERIDDPALRSELDELTAGYASKEDFFVDKVAEGVATIAAAFYPRRIIVRFSDFKSNEYFNLLGGSYFEPEESNPMLGLRGASRYYSELYAPAFALEMKAIKKVREKMGLDNVCVMVPFVRTLHEADTVIDLLRGAGLEQGVNKLDYFMMVEVPSNVILLEEFAQRFNGFSIGSNDLTQFVLAVDRDSGYLTKQFNEQDKAVHSFLQQAVGKARSQGRYIGICGQAPSDYPEIGNMLLNAGISSLSLNPDAVLPFVVRLNNQVGK